ncbi:fibrillarin-like rRNA/tRNA 2'-O-methyltransferase [Candidatus Woesearchaeota archaeon]|nr:fibrillarin-like rRNA/tRNA 2'-O-methyltransferase [Candidatus Woesearchaeota archaeon]
MKEEQTNYIGVYQKRKGGRRIFYTKSFAPGKDVYGETTFKINNIEYREWDAHKSKLSSAMLKGISQTGIKEDSVVLYLGAASGTTVSHISDILGDKGFIFALDFAPRVVRDLVFVCEDRKNIAPILADANKPESYVKNVSQADIIYQDIAQKNQVDIFLKNCDLFLKKDGIAMLCIKARSINVAENPKKIFNEVRDELRKRIKILAYCELFPFQKDHCFFVCKKERFK